MGSSDDQSSSTDQVTNGTVDLGLVLGEPGDLFVVLHVAGIAKQHNTLNHVLNTAVEAADGVVHHCGSLAI